MEEHISKVFEITPVTHDVKRFKIIKPDGYTFTPGQATDVSLNLPEWKNELRPFTFTSLNEWDFLEFTIKIYNDHAGLTNMLGQIEIGAELILHEVFGVINYQGKGIFIAGGAGITPFIAIFRQLYHTGQLKGNKLIYSNKTAADVILEDELDKMMKPDFIKIFTREKSSGQAGKRIDKTYLRQTISDFNQPFYVCGPDPFVKDITKHLNDLGANPQQLIFEK
jgi:ferredoxin-NADP reductase